VDVDFLLTRAADLAVLGVRLRNVTVDSSTAPVTATADDAARIVLFLPPQHIAEEERQDAPPDGWQAQSQLAGVSRLAFALTRGSRFPLDAAGILGACGQLVSDSGTAGPFDTAIEMPWHLAFSVLDPGGGIVSSLHAAEQIVSPGGGTALWLSRLGVQADAQGQIVDPGDPARPLELVPVDANLANTPNEAFAQSLSQSDRNEIVQLSATPGTGPQASRIELTSIGGSLTAGRQWPGFLWDHRATLGRDQEVVIVETGVCYPFGFRAELTTVVRRRPEDPGSSDPAALRVARAFRFLQTYQSAPGGGLFSRSFPFVSVEVTRPDFEDVGALDIVFSSPRPTPDLSDLQNQLASQQNQANDDQQAWQPLVSLVWTLDNLAWSGNQHALELQAISLQLNGDGNQQGINALIATLKDAEAAADALADQLQQAERQLQQLEAAGDQNAIDAQQAVIDDLVQQESQISTNPALLATLTAQAQQLNAQADADLQALQPLLGQPRPVADAATEAASLGVPGSEQAQDWLDLQGPINDLSARIAVQVAAAVTTDIAGWPRDSAGATLRFPLLLRTRNQQLHVPMPLIFVKDVVLPAVDTVPEYDSLSDPALPPALDTAWLAAQAGMIPLEGSMLDIVGSATPQPQDTHEVHALNLLGSLDSDPFTPSLGRPQATDPKLQWALRVALPALRALGSEVPAPDPPAGFPGLSQILDAPDLSVPPGFPVLPGVPVAFDETFLQIGEQAPALLRPLAGIAIDFTSHADRSGGLAALQLTADAISRERGPVQLAGLTRPDPSGLIGPTATLLGFKLQDLLRSLPTPLSPPAIVSELADGQQPVVRMEWTAVPLRDLLALRTYPDATHPDRKSTLDLVVITSLDEVSTTCTVTDFALVFPPPGGTDLLRLDVASLKFYQHTTHQQAQPPQLSVGALNMTFLGPLTFLQTLQDAVHLLGSGPNIQASPAGVTASFVLPIAPVSCGVFNLSNITFRADLDVPFGGDPVVVSVGFASRTSPFNLSVSGLGGGGYIEIRIEKDTPRIEASLEFGASLAVDFLVAAGEVHALGSVRYLQDGSEITLTGYVRLGGSVEVLGLISVSIELVVQLGYDFGTNVLSGRATLVLELDLTLWSDSVEIDSGEWTFQGGLHHDAQVLQALPADDGLAGWRRYRSAFTGAAA
jgi:hypothetical protein